MTPSTRTHVSFSSSTDRQLKSHRSSTWTEAVTPPTRLHGVGTPRSRPFGTASRTAVVSRSEIPPSPLPGEEYRRCGPPSACRADRSSPSSYPTPAVRCSALGHLAGYGEVGVTARPCCVLRRQASVEMARLVGGHDRRPAVPDGDLRDRSGGDRPVERCPDEVGVVHLTAHRPYRVRLGDDDDRLRRPQPRDEAVERTKDAFAGVPGTLAAVGPFGERRRTTPREREPREPLERLLGRKPLEPAEVTGAPRAVRSERWRSEASSRSGSRGASASASASTWSRPWSVSRAGAHPWSRPALVHVVSPLRASRTRPVTVGGSWLRARALVSMRDRRDRHDPSPGGLAASGPQMSATPLPWPVSTRRWQRRVGRRSRLVAGPPQQRERPFEQHDHRRRDDDGGHPRGVGAGEEGDAGEPAPEQQPASL